METTKTQVIVRLGDSYLKRDESGEIFETVETLADGSPNWDEAGIADHRGAGGAEGYRSLVGAFDALEHLATL
jgi:hypothetical protein